MSCISSSRSGGQRSRRPTKRTQTPWRRVAAGRRADADEGEAVWPGVRAAGRLRVEADEGALADGDVLAVDHPVAGAGDHDRDLLLAGASLAVLLAGGVRRKVEAVD